MIKGKRIVLLAALCFLLALSGCAKKESAEAVDAAEERTAEAVSEEKQAPASGSGKTVEEMIAEKNRPEETVSNGGETYALKKNVESYLILGIDLDLLPEYGNVQGAGQCDVILLLVMDNDAKQYTTLQINRDSAVEIEILDFNGKQTGLMTKQVISLAHSYGDGREASCENTVRAVSRMLGGINIDGYASLRYSAVPALNDAVGGIYVTIEDDFSKEDPSFVMGETVELTGDNVLTYVRGRMSVGDGSNIGRQRRQRTYLNAFEKRFKEKLRGNSSIINDLYNLAKPYLVTDMSLGTISNVAMKSLSYRNNGFVNIKGSARYPVYKGTKYLEIDLDSDSVTQTVLALYYTKIT